MLALSDDLLTAQEIAAALRVHVKTFHRWCRMGRGPIATRLGHSLPRYARSDVEPWLLECRERALADSAGGPMRLAALAAERPQELVRAFRESVRGNGAAPRA